MDILLEMSNLRFRNIRPAFHPFSTRCMSTQNVRWLIWCCQGNREESVFNFLQFEGALYSPPTGTIWCRYWRHFLYYRHKM